MKTPYLALVVAALVLPFGAMAAHGNTNYTNCVAQKTSVAQHYCKKAGKSCKAEIKAAKKECHAEVKQGLTFSHS